MSVWVVIDVHRIALDPVTAGETGLGRPGVSPLSGVAWGRCHPICHWLSDFPICRCELPKCDLHGQVIAKYFRKSRISEMGGREPRRRSSR